MKLFIQRVFWLTCIVVVIAIGIRSFHTVSNTPPIEQIQENIISPTSNNHASLTVRYKDKNYAYEYFTVSDRTKLTLIPNFTQKKTFTEILTSNHCTAGINGSYYDTNDMPLGGFISGGKALKQPITSRLMDGYISVADVRMDIGLSPLPNSSILLQTGPLLFLNNTPLTLRISSDEPARRSISVKTKNDSIYFFIIYDPDSVYLGPYLADLPQIVDIIHTDMSLSIVSAINLDGGNASAFKNSTITLNELTHVGSIFCVQ